MKNLIKSFLLCTTGAYVGAIFGTTFAYMKEEERRKARAEKINHADMIKLTPKGREVAELLLKASREQKGSGSASA